MTRLADALSGGGRYVTGAPPRAAAGRSTHGFEGRGAGPLTPVVKDAGRG
ncbi:hypothetical protein ACFC0M_31135 [Streptomyces sp. NPDC056149]|nr:hypothetical protein [Streptomyces sp. WZ-12]